VATEPYSGIQPMTRTLATVWYEKGQRELLREQLEERFGALPPPVLERLQQLPAEQLPPLGKAVLHAQSLREMGLQD
jgi:Domain of unknown function (DUF4351)